MPTRDPLLSDEHAELQLEAIKFAKKSLAGSLIARDRTATFDRAWWKACADFGLLKMPLPRAAGGLETGLTGLIAVMEGLGYATEDQGLLFSLNAHLWTNTIPLLRYGTDAQKARWLAGLSDGTLIGANGASEPDSGSDVFSMRTRARKDGDAYVLDGSKTWVSNGPVADVFVCYATVEPEAGVLGVTAFVIEKGTPGLSVGSHIEKMGLRTSPMSELVFDGCRVPAENMLGREGRGAEVFNCSMEWERGAIMASCLGVMRRQLETCVKYARTRKQFGKAIGKFQSVANRIVDMKVRLDTSRPLVYRIGWLKDRDLDAFGEAAVAKLHVSNAYVQSSLDAIQVHGGYGYAVEQGIERDLRDAVGSTIYSGTSEIQRNLIAKSLGL